MRWEKRKSSFATVAVSAAQRVQPSFRDVWIFPFGGKRKVPSLRSGVVRRDESCDAAVRGWIGAEERVQPSFRNVWIFPFVEMGNIPSLRLRLVRRGESDGTAVQYYVYAGEWVVFSLWGKRDYCFATVGGGAAQRVRRYCRTILYRYGGRIGMIPSERLG